MSNNNFRPPDSSPEIDHADQSNFEFPEEYTFDGWLEDYPEAIISGPIENHVNQANEVNVSACTSSLLQRPAGNSKNSRCLQS